MATRTSCRSSQPWRRGAALAACLLWLVAPTVTRAEEPEERPAAAAQKPSPKDMRERLDLKSGEIVKGDLLYLRDGDVRFDSSEFDEVKISFSDIVAFSAPEPHTYRFAGRRIYMGSGEMRDGVITIQTSEQGRIVLPRDELVAITRGTGEEFDFWSGKVTFGLAARAGNTNQADLTALIDLWRRTPFTRFNVSYNAAFGNLENNAGIKETTTNNQRVGTQLDFLVTERFFVTAPVFEYYTNPLQNIQTRLTPGVAVGYDVIADWSWLEWDVSSGVGYQYTDFTGAAPSDNDFALSISTNLDLDLPRGIEWDTSYRVQLVVTNFGNTNHHLLSILSFDIWGPLDLDVTFNWDRTEKPQGVGVVPDDLRISIGLGIEF